MHITYFIGNGFDLSLGLKTRYKDFLNYYLSVKTNDKDITKFKNEIKKNIDTWADAELAFGQYVSGFNIDSVDYLTKCHKDFCAKLNEYLQHEQRKIAIFDPEYIINNMFQFANGLRLEERSFLAYKSSEEICNISKNHINFVNFNYTTTLDKCVNLLQNNIKYKNVFGRVVHIHGVGKDLLLGVDNFKQIGPQVLSDSRIACRFIKPISNRLLKNGRESQVENYISNSDIICIFGMSLGITDMKWWIKILDRLSLNPSLNIIIMLYDKKYVLDTDYDYLDILNDVETKLRNMAEMATNDFDIIRHRIHIIVNYDLLKIDQYNKMQTQLISQKEQ